MSSTGLSTTRAKAATAGYCYGDKLVGLLVAPQSRGISYLNKNGEVHVKAIRNENGEITGLAELSEDEYNKVVTELDGMKSDMQEHMNEMRKKMQERFQSGTFGPGNFEWGANGIHESMQERMNQMRSEMEQRLNDIMNNIPNGGLNNQSRRLSFYGRLNNSATCWEIILPLEQKTCLSSHR
jgi:hypothetical protein